MKLGAIAWAKHYKTLGSLLYPGIARVALRVGEGIWACTVWVITGGMTLCVLTVALHDSCDLAWPNAFIVAFVGSPTDVTVRA
jgi:hypothetical protein